MVHLKKILVPVDFSGPSKKAVNYGLSLALQFNARVVLAHITPYDELAYQRAKSTLLQLIPVEHRERLDYEIIVKAGDVRAELLGIADEGDIDLIVMGSRGRSFFERMILGSVTERLLRKVHVPILTVSHIDPEKEIQSPGPVPLQRLVYATDLMEGSEPGLEFSLRLARGLDAFLTVVHVVQPLDAAFPTTELAGHMPDNTAQLRAQSAEKMARTISLVSDGSVPVTTVVAEGIPYDAINRTAAESKADLIIINLQGKSRLDRALLGTTAERVIRTATVPVLSLPMPATYAARWEAA
jgi:nucleotide-binding universal stress UspA family protein